MGGQDSHLNEVGGGPGPRLLPTPEARPPLPPGPQRPRACMGGVWGVLLPTQKAASAFVRPPLPTVSRAALLTPSLHPPALMTHAGCCSRCHRCHRHDPELRGRPWAPSGSSPPGTPVPSRANGGRGAGDTDKTQSSPPFTGKEIQSPFQQEPEVPAGTAPPRAGSCGRSVVAVTSPCGGRGQSLWGGRSQSPWGWMSSRARRFCWLFLRIRASGCLLRPL